MPLNMRHIPHFPICASLTGSVSEVARQIRALAGAGTVALRPVRTLTGSVAVEATLTRPEQIAALAGSCAA